MSPIPYKPAAMGFIVIAAASICFGTFLLQRDRFFSPALGSFFLVSGIIVLYTTAKNFIEFCESQASTQSAANASNRLPRGQAPMFSSKEWLLGDVPDYKFGEAISESAIKSAFTIQVATLLGKLKRIQVARAVPEEFLPYPIQDLLTDWEREAVVAISIIRQIPNSVDKTLISTYVQLIHLCLEQTTDFSADLTETASSLEKMLKCLIDTFPDNAELKIPQFTSPS